MISLKNFFEKVESKSDQGESQDEAKRAAAKAALDLVEPGMKLGLGTGSTVEFFLQGLAKKIKSGLRIAGGVPTSLATEARAKELGIPLLGVPHYQSVETDLCVDGADRVDLRGCLIKGGGGALLREKLVASHSKNVCIMVDPSKLRTVFDDSFALPVECIGFGILSTLSRLRELGCEPQLRSKPDSEELYLSDNGHYLVDCKFAEIPEPEKLADSLSALVGVVDGGLFCGLLDHLVVGFRDGTASEWSRSGSS